MPDWFLNAREKKSREERNNNEQLAAGDQRGQGRTRQAQQGRVAEEDRGVGAAGERPSGEEARKAGAGEEEAADEGPGEEGSEDIDVSEGDKSQDSGEEDTLRRAWKRARHGDDGGEDPEYIEARIPKHIMDIILPVALKEGLTIRQTVVMLAAFLTSAGVDLEKVILSRTTCHRRLVEQCEEIGDEGLNQFVDDIKREDQGVVCHFDGKLMEQDFGRRETQNRLVLLLKSPWLERERLVGVAPLEVETGYGCALEVFGQLLNLGVEDKVIAAVFDSTGVNTGEEEGAAIHLQRLLDRPILEVECIHHQQVHYIK